MSMEDIREYEKQMHDETNKIVGRSAEPAAVPATARSCDDESPGVP